MFKFMKTQMSFILKHCLVQFPQYQFCILQNFVSLQKRSVNLPYSLIFCQSFSHSLLLQLFTLSAIIIPSYSWPSAQGKSIAITWPDRDLSSTNQLEVHPISCPSCKQPQVWDTSGQELCFNAWLRKCLMSSSIREILELISVKCAEFVASYFQPHFISVASIFFLYPRNFSLGMSESI